MKDFFSLPIRIISNGNGTIDSRVDCIDSLDNAVKLGADCVRINIAITKDGHIVSISDSFITSKHIKGPISSYGINEFNRCAVSLVQPLCSNQALFPSLGDILNALPNVRFNLNVIEKSLPLFEGILAEIKLTNSAPRLLMSSNYGECIEFFRKSCPDIATSFSLFGLIGFYGIFRIGLLPMIKRFKADAFVAPESIGLSMLANNGIISSLKKLGIKSYYYYVDTEKSARSLAEAGADGIITRNISGVKDFFV
jgi:glycerophosphoryl diester phosphodiesterase